MNLKATSVLLAFGLLGLAALSATPAAAHACAFESGPSCAAECDASGGHVHWGPRLVPCVSTGPLPLVSPLP